MSIGTGATCVFHGKRHPREMGAAEVEAFLSHLANARNVFASTHQQALSALLFLYKRVLDIDLPWLGDLIWPLEASAPPGGVDSRGGEHAVGSHVGHAAADDTAALRQRGVLDGMRSLAGEGCGVLSPRDRRARRQGRQGPDDDAAGVVGRGSGGAAPTCTFFLGGGPQPERAGCCPAVL